MNGTMLSSRRVLEIAMPGILAFVAIGCQPSAPTPAPTVAPTAAAEAPATPEEMEAVRLRAEWGLPADLAHVRAVAADPTASEYLSIPMLPTEIADMQARAANADAVREIVQAEANASPDDFCGFYIDNQNGGAFTSMWRANLVVHQAAVRARVGPTARVAFRTCRFSQQELDAVCTGIGSDDHGWLDALPAQWQGTECRSADNFVTMYISSAIPDAEARVLQHYADLLDLPPGILVVASDGTGAALKPWGTVLITVLGMDGKPVGENSLNLDWSSDFEGIQCGGGDVGYGVSWDDKPAELPCQEGTWTIRVVGLPALDQDFVDYATKVVVVRGNEETRVTFRLTEPPPPLGFN
ncbi:MAG TPA: hypothetical protein VJ850_12020 [Candidatus Limnocylindrales bacterium]|nr:hypothetical protein [Candidatus Limnocylindrales bacterium]